MVGRKRFPRGFDEPFGPTFVYYDEEYEPMAGFMTVKRLRALLASPSLDDKIVMIDNNTSLFLGASPRAVTEVIDFWKEAIRPAGVSGSLEAEAALVKDKEDAQ